jgi:hypothetical protein
MTMTTDNEGVTIVDLPFRPTPEQIALKTYETTGLSFESATAAEQDLWLGMMADAVRLDRRQRLAHRVAHARNYAYEATMSDYSQESIDRSVRALGELALEAQVDGYSLDDLAVWTGEQWKPVIA